MVKKKFLDKFNLIKKMENKIIYETPVVEIIECMVEKGFAVSIGYGEAIDDGVTD